MFCKNCGMELTEGTKFCKNCGTKIDSEKVNNIKETSVENNDTKSSTENTVKKIIKIESGRKAINGERQLISIFEFMNDKVDTRCYLRTTKRDPKHTYHFKKNIVSDLKYTRIGYPGFATNFRRIASVLIIGLGIILGSLATIGIGLIPIVGNIIFYGTQVLIIKLKTGEKIMVYYDFKEDVKELVNELVYE